MGAFRQRQYFRCNCVPFPYRSLAWRVQGYLPRHGPGLTTTNTTTHTRFDFLRLLVISHFRLPP